MAGGGIDSNTKLALRFDGANGSTTFTDQKFPTGHTVTSDTGTVTTASAKYGTGSLTGAVSIPDHADFDFATADFTIDAFVRFTNGGAIYGTIISKHGDAVGANSWAFEKDSSNGIQLRYSTDGTNDVYLNSAWSPSIDTWYHVAVVRSGNNLYFFVDGVQQGTTKNVTGVDIFTTTTTVRIGDTRSGSNVFNGYIDEVRVSSTARWTAAFNIPGQYNLTGGNMVEVFGV